MDTNTPASAAPGERRPLLDEDGYWTLGDWSVKRQWRQGGWAETTIYRNRECVAEGMLGLTDLHEVIEQVLNADCLARQAPLVYPPLAARVKGLESEVERLKRIHARLRRLHPQEYFRAGLPDDEFNQWIAGQAHAIKNMNEVLDNPDYYAPEPAAPSGNADSTEERATEE